MYLYEKVSASLTIVFTILSICLTFLFALLCLKNDSPAMKKAVSLLSLTTPNSNRKRRRLKDTLAQLTKETEISPFPPPRKRQSAENSLSIGSLLDISNTPETCKALTGKIKKMVINRHILFHSKDCVVAQFYRRSIFADKCNGSDTCILVLWLVTCSSSENRTHPSLFQRTE